MKRIVISLAVATCLIVPAAALACEGDGQHQAKATEPTKATVADVASWTKAKKATPVDANGKETRSTQGVIPGAVLLTSSSTYAVSELPADKASKLVFYCANQKCGASHAAAKRAMENGYTDVAVLPEGIAGWKQAGQPTAKPNNT
ncbi:MAG: rhodanese-like domain-containing protein [Archangium sp.]|nr:rhodanese-like domain-containing protein [Archangium sp.]